MLRTKDDFLFEAVPLLRDQAPGTYIAALEALKEYKNQTLNEVLEVLRVNDKHGISYSEAIKDIINLKDN